MRGIFKIIVMFVNRFHALLNVLTLIYLWSFVRISWLIFDITLLLLMRTINFKTIDLALLQKSFFRRPYDDYLSVTTVFLHFKVIPKWVHTYDFSEEKHPYEDEWSLLFRSWVKFLYISINILFFRMRAHRKDNVKVLCNWRVSDKYMYSHWVGLDF